ncbi:MAG: 23S rRNA (guanosine(2251)-2'-O)-methyltransferase RlmB [Bacteroidota bacterium]
MSSSTIYGRNPVVEALDNNLQIEKVFLQNNLHGEFEVLIRNKCKDRNIPLTKVPSRKLNDLSRSRNHQGIVAYISPVEYTRVDQLIPKLFDDGKVPLMLVLDGVTDVRNMGAIARCAKVFGAHGIVVPAKGTARVSDEMVKSSAGAILDVPLCRENSLPVALETMQMLGLSVYATDVNAEKTIAEMDLKSPIAIVMGSEDLGVSKKSIQISDATMKIPQVDRFDSLNVSVASGIILYEVLLQRVF